VTLRATESLKKKAYTEDARLCFYPQFEKLPKPEPLKAEKGRNGRKIAGDVQTLTSPGAGAEVQKLIDIEYPSETTVLKNASEYSRVTEPTTKINNSKIM
jgi:hypothetical protein